MPAPPGPVIVTSRAPLASSPFDLGKHIGSPDEPVMERRQARRRKRLQRREVLAQFGRDELEELCCSRNVLQSMAPERPERTTRERLVADHVSHRPRHDDLLPVRGGTDPRGDDDVHPDVALVAELRLTRVQTDAETVSLGRRPRLGCE